ncbi:MAG: hypothetical protein IH941_03900 [Acidobacteria bacterium]|nr:hypothetical protein [Acidobacteriota bacterium]
MADQALIDQYLGELAREVRWIRNAEDIIEEVADHLLEAAAAFTHRGLDRIAAQKRALTEFGDPTLVGRAFASSTTGGIAVPTNFTKRAGVALIASGFFWLTALVLIYSSEIADRTRPWEGLPLVLYLIGVAALMTAGVLLAMGILGINRRHGGALGVAGRIVMWIAVVTAVTAFGSWFWGPWLTSLGVGAALLAAALEGSDISPKLAGRLVGLGGAFAAGSAWAFQITTDEVELGEGAFTVFVFAGLALYSIGLIMLGAWLKAEEAVEEQHELTATA